MLIIVVTANNYTIAEKQVKMSLALPIDAIELRLDYLTKLNLEKIKILRQSSSIPVIFTLRKQTQGGVYKNSEEERLKLIEKLFTCNPDYFDLEFDIPKTFLKRISAQYPGVRLICSYHNFEQTPLNLHAILSKIKQEQFFIYKIATQANSTMDVLRMLDFLKTKKKVCGICLGELGKPTRILGPLFSNQMYYFSPEQKQQKTLGQTSLKDFLYIYHHHTLNPKTKIYALLGNPVIYSDGHIFHNQKFLHLKKNAVYLKLCLSAEELEEFFFLIKNLPFAGFSITMPLKEAILPYLDELRGAAKYIQAVNTILIEKNKLIGFNTDCTGALNTIEKRIKVKNKKMIIIGAGGTAKAIAYEALRRGSKVIVLNRKIERAQKLALELNCLGYGLNYIDQLAKEGYDILVNTTPLGMHNQKQQLPIPKNTILNGCVVMDMVAKPKLTPFLKMAEAKNCICIYGKEVFVNQASEQSQIWMKNF